MAKKNKDVFINCPFDDEYDLAFIGLISSLTLLGLTPRSVLEIPSHEYRLKRLVKIMSSCRFSIHDLSRVELDNNKPKCPRFNMPFELGMAASINAIGKKKHDFFILEQVHYRLQKSLSDVNGHDPYIHDCTGESVSTQLQNIFESESRNLTQHHFDAAFSYLLFISPNLIGRGSLYSTSSFKKLVTAALQIAEEVAKKDYDHLDL